ncbi:MAG: hypothetical protein M1830_010019 [Pleopsidium flavum]|nr:MAG: hypothetical protein M1830_010019 [Pleopsidium flavum]
MLFDFSAVLVSAVEGASLPLAITVGVLVTIFLAVVGFLWRHTNGSPRLLPGVSFVGLDGGKRSIADARLRFRTHSAAMLEEGYKMTNGGFFYVPALECDRLMIPTKYIEELKNAPDDKADFIQSFVEMFEGEYTTIGKRWDLHPRVVKGSLNPSLPTVLPHVEEEIAVAFSKVIPPCEDWTPIPIADAFKRIVAQASGRMIGGLTLARNPQWLQTSIDFTTDSWMAAQRMKSYPFWAKPVMQWLIPEMVAVRRHIKVARKFIKPLLRERERVVDEQGEKAKPVDLLQMLHDNARDQDRHPDFLAYTALAVSFAAIHTSASVPTHLVYDLCARPEYIPPLREEVEQMLEEMGGFTKAGLAKLVKMDSFMKESQRFNPLVFMTFGRVMHSDYTLHDGVTIPAGTIIGVPSHAISHDPSFFEDPSTFDGFRFVPPSESDLNLRRRDPPSFVTTNASNLGWGYGKHACSGRFFASHEIKMITAYLLLNFDFKLAGKGTDRPANVSFELQNSPDPMVNVLLKRRNQNVKV